MVPGAWEIQRQSVLCVILHTEMTTIAWSLGLRNLIIPGGILPITGLPFDHARNVGAREALRCGASHCFRSDVIVETITGGKKIKDVRVGDLVRTHLGRYRSVSHVFSRELRREAHLRWVITPNSTIKCTPEHPFYVRRGGVDQFVLADDLKCNDMLLYPAEDRQDWLRLHIEYNSPGDAGGGKRGSEKNGSYLFGLPVTEDLARFLGLYLAEGHSDEGNGIGFTFNNLEEDYIQFICSMSKLLFGRRAGVVKKHATTVRISIRPLASLFAEWFGDNAKDKRIPEFVFGWSLLNKLRFLEGYFQGDGHVNKGILRSGGCEYKQCAIQNFGSASKRLVDDVVRLGVTCGLIVKYCGVKAQVCVTKEGGVINSGPSYHGWLAKKSSDKMKDLLGARRNGEYLEVPIVSIKDKRLSGNCKDKFVYNLEVEEDNSYIVDCTAVHNCFYLDSDVIPPKDAILRLLSRNKPIVSGLYCRRSPPHSIPVCMRPTGQWITQINGPLMEVDVVGAGCLLIHRGVLERLPPLDPNRGKTHFDWRVDMGDLLPPGNALSEDFSFCKQVREKLGIKILVDTTVRCRHVGMAEATYGQFVPLDTNRVD